MTIPVRLATALADRYTLERELGQGGMATVYLAQDVRHDRKVAVKVLRPELAASIGPDRFLREIRIAAQLQHPHILPLLESGDADGFLYYVMPFVDGESLRERLARQGELPVHEAIRLIEEVVDALSYAHAHGVVHRDVKPDNVMLSGRHALVMDFGVAKAVSEASGRNQLTTAGVALGTPAYMAPEQAAADPHLDHRVDIYAVGVMAYELLGGRPPFTGGTPQQVLAAHVTQAPEPLSKYRPGISAALEQTIMRCLAKRPADRWQTADELMAQLEPLVTPSGGMTPTGTRPVTAWQPGSGRRGWWIGAGLAASVGIAALVWARGTGRPAASARAVELDRVQLTFTGNTDHPALSPDGQRLAYSSRRCADTGRCVLDVVVQDVGGAGSATVVRDVQALWELDWSSDGRYLVFSGSFSPTRWGVFSVPALGGDPRPLGCCAAHLTPAGDTALVVSTPGPDSVAWLHRVTVADGIVHDSIPLPKSSDRVPELASLGDGGLRLMIDQPLLSVLDGRMRVLDTLRLADPGFVGAVAIPADRRFLEVWESPRTQGEYVVLRRSVSADGRIAATADTIIRQLAMTSLPSVSRSRQLVFGSGAFGSAVLTFHRAPDQMQFPLRELAAATSLSVSGSVAPAGDRVLLVRYVLVGDRRLRQFSVAPMDGGAETRLGSPMDATDWDWAQDGRSIVVAERSGTTARVQRLDAATGRLVPLTTMPAADLGAVESLPGNGFVILTQSGREIRRYTASGQPDSIFHIAHQHGTINSLDPSPDGREILTMGWDEATDSLAFLRVSLTDGRVTPVVRMGGEGGQQPVWLADGSAILPVLETSWTLVWYRLPPGGGKLTRMGSPPRFPADYRLSRDGRHGIARVTERKGDVYVIRNFTELLDVRTDR